MAYDVVFPTPVGVFPHIGLTDTDDLCLPHARGGVSMTGVAKNDPPRSSPRPWGCFSPILPNRPNRCVFPTPVGVFPQLAASNAEHKGLPHARGGVSVKSFTIDNVT